MTSISQKIAFSAASWAILATAVNAPLANAANLVDNGSEFFAFWLSDFDESVQLADRFTLNKDAEITEITWSGQYSNNGTPPVDDFTIRFFEIDRGTVSLAPLVELNLSSVERTDSGTDFFRLDLFDYSATFTPFTLEQGEYLLSIVNNTTGEPDNWFWSSTLPPPTQDYVHFYREKDGEPWQDNFLGNMAFAIAGNTVSTPEPSMILGTLIALGLGAISIKSKTK
ncbi:MAG: hypothetical protein MUD14_05240 [Hydrococcus sp. Prado102]|jgi:hypothetical protein|nr:hypothetical protein [Hydrococcus sp. Prado102]